MTKNSASKPRVVVGLSGGVDSSVAAALLLQQGYDVVGVYMNNWNSDSVTLGENPLECEAYRLECPWYDDYLDAKRVALHLSIPFYLWDFREAYKKKVFDHFIDAFAKGATPNPDIYCNSLIKFADFLVRAVEELGADYIATGHYARVVSRTKGKPVLQIPSDKHKDQTYFLYRLTSSQLARVLFPLADFTKTEVRKLAAEFDLPTKYKKDSQGICFVGDVEIRQFISHWLASKPGEVVDEQGQVIGAHDGVHNYTIGEKIAVDGKLVAKLFPASKHALPHYYVASKDATTGVIVAVPGAEHPALSRQTIALEQLHWVDGPVLADVRARIRHGGELVAIEATTLGSETSAEVTFLQPVRALAPGQHIVFYDAADQVVGGGVIDI